MPKRSDRRKNRMGRLYTSIAIAATMLSGCNSTPKPPYKGRVVEFGAIVIGTTSRAEAIRELGPPSASFEQKGILTYRIAHKPEYTERYVIPRNENGGWGGVRYSLVLTFNVQGILDQCSFVEVKDE